jgi:hypothetical protein
MTDLLGEEKQIDSTTTVDSLFLFLFWNLGRRSIVLSFKKKTENLPSKKKAENRSIYS